MLEFKHKYYSHLKALNPNLESSYQSAQYYYKAEIQPLLPKEKCARILDVGCGHFIPLGLYSPPLAA